MTRHDTSRFQVAIQRIRSLTDRHVRASTRNLLKSLLLRRNLPDLGSRVNSYGEFWDKAHDAGSHLWLTGSPPDEVFTRLGVQKWLSDANIKVLDVGVGEGLMAKRLREMDICFDCLDISPIALNKVRNLCRAVFLEAENLPSSEYSLIMHHLVAQHMDDSELRRQIMHLVRSLRPGGAIALQFAAPIGVEERSATENSMSFEKIVTGGFLRSTGEISEIVRSAGGQVAALLPREQWSRSSCQFWVAHIGRDDSDAAAND